MKTAILSIGTELLFGQITNTNTVYLSRELQLLGYDVMYHYTVGDNPKRLKTLIEEIFRDCDLILTTGGLGPTQDDLTKETVCEALHDNLVEVPEQIEILKANFSRMNRKMTENNLKQAWFPSRAVILENDIGTAPGFALSEGEKTVISMPGPPREMTRMFERQVKPYLLKKQDSVIYYKIIKTYGIGESQLETVLLPLINNQTDPTIATYAKEGESYLRIASKRKTSKEAETAVNDMLEKVKSIIGQYIYSCDDETMAEVVVKLLKEKGLKISSSESCTGGQFASTLTDIPGSSEVFSRGYVTYSNDAKINDIDVPAEIIEEFGVFSGETALAMAIGTKNKSGSDIAVAITGIAGPDGGTEEKPVGTVYISVVYHDKEIINKHTFRNAGRKYIKNCSVLAMFAAVYSILKEC